MGFMQAMKSANNAWARLTSKDGWGYLGPKNFVDNRSHELLFSIGTDTKVVTRNDIAAVQTIALTSTWAKFRIILKDRSEYTASFTVMGVAANGKQDFSSGLLNFEFWLDGLIYQQNYSTTSTVATSSPTSGGTSTTYANVQSATPPTATAQASFTAQALQGYDEIEEENAQENEKPKGKKPVSADDEEKEKQYQFAQQMIGAHSYTVAYNALIKIKGYKNVNALLKQLQSLI